LVSVILVSSSTSDVHYGRQIIILLPLALQPAVGAVWLVEQYISIFPYLSPTLSIFSLPALEDLFLLLLSILSWVSLFVSSLPVLE
jgi:hypothetical protein